MNINDINDAWIAKGQEVADLDAQITKTLLDDASSEEDIKNLKQQREAKVARRDALKDQLDNLRANESVQITQNSKKPLNDNQNNQDEFVKNFKGMMHGDPKVLNMVTSKDDDGHNAGLTIPTDVQTKINELKRQYDSLEPYVNVEKVATTTGSRVYEKWTDVTPLADLDDETAQIGDNDDPQLTLIKYSIHRYAGISTLTNTLLKDTDQNILNWISNWIAKKTVVTRNLKIIDAFNALPEKATIAKFDDIIDLINLGVDPAIKSTSLLLTNTSGFNALSKVKTATGEYLLQPDPKAADQFMVKGKRIVTVGDRWLPNGGTAAAPSYPLYFGDPKQAITLFDRENMSLLSTNIGAGAFEQDLSKIRVIDRFDVEATDSEAFVAGSFKKIADQPAMISTSNPTPSA